MRPWAHSHPFCSELRFGQRYNMLSGARTEEDRDIDGSEGTATKKSECKKNAVFEVDGVPSHYTREMRKIMTSNYSRRDPQVTDCVQTVHF